MREVLCIIALKAAMGPFPGWDLPRALGAWTYACAVLGGCTALAFHFRHYFRNDKPRPWAVVQSLFAWQVFTWAPRQFWGLGDDAIQAMRTAGERLGSTHLLENITLVPMAEELLFRGILGRAAVERYGTFPGLALASLLFAMDHGSWEGGPYYFASGMLLGLIALRTRSLTPGILCHSFTNLLASP